MNRAKAAAEVERLMSEWSISIHELFHPPAEAQAWRTPFLLRGSTLHGSDIDAAIESARAIKFLSVPCESGLYVLLNVDSCRFYVGGSVNMRTRLRKHIYSLHAGDHENGALQTDYDANGTDECLRFGVIARVAKDVLYWHERVAIGLSNTRNLYNSVGADWTLRDCGGYAYYI